MKKYFTVFLAFIIYFNVFSQAHAAKNYNVKTIVYDPLEKVIQATTLDRIAEKTMQRTARVPVTASATGSTVASMIRLGVAGAVIYGIVEGVGWVIENGQVKKPVPVGPEVIYEYIWQFDSSRQNNSATDLCKSMYTASGDGSGGTPIYLRLDLVSVDQAKCVFKQYNREGYNYLYRVKNPKYNPDSWKLVPVPDSDLGAEINKNPKAPDVLPEVYNPNNPAGGAAPQTTSDAIDKAAPEPETKPNGDTKPKPNKDTNGDGVPDTYDPALPSAGEEFTLPAFCEWATTMCAWYEKYQEDSKKVDEHREKEKTFWEKITDWIDWTKEEPEKEEEPDRPEIDDQGIFSRTFDTVFSLSKQCPPDVPYSFETQYLKGNFTISLNWLCMIFTFLGYPLQLIAHLTGLWILYETVVRKEIKW